VSPNMSYCVTTLALNKKYGVILLELKDGVTDSYFTYVMNDTTGGGLTNSTSSPTTNLDERLSLLYGQVEFFLFASYGNTSQTSVRSLYQ